MELYIFFNYSFIAAGFMFVIENATINPVNFIYYMISYLIGRKNYHIS